MSDPFLGEIKLVGFNFAPLDWAFCDGQLLSIAQNTALFSILGTTYGGDGVTTFALPNLRGRVPLHPGTNVLGTVSGAATVTLTSAEIPAHTHVLRATTSEANVLAPDGATLAAATSQVYADQLSQPVALAAGALAAAGGSQPHENMQPYLALNFVIALSGIFPSRS